MSDFNGLPTRTLENGRLRLDCLAEAGPRLVGLSYRGSPNLLAEVPDVFWVTAHGRYHPLGGHRLWIAPEVPDTTYVPDGAGLQVQELPNGLELTGAVEAGSGVRKRLRVTLDPDRPVVHLLHTVVNESPKALTLAPWAITMFRLGGTVILPQPVGEADPHGKLSNRLLVLWPYTRIHDPRLQLADDFITLKADPDVPACKLGYFNPHGWMAYWIDGLLFIKRCEAYAGENLPDRGCNSETYCGDRFVELETLGPLVKLEPRGAVVHAETWEVYERLEQEFITPGLRKRLGG
jgi:hypothetical protein